MSVRKRLGIYALVRMPENLRAVVIADDPTEARQLTGWDPADAERAHVTYLGAAFQGAGSASQAVARTIVVQR